MPTSSAPPSMMTTSAPTPEAAIALRQQVQQWASVIDVAEKEIQRKANEVSWLKQRIRTTEWESLAAQRDAHATKEALAKTQAELEKTKRQLRIAKNEEESTTTEKVSEEIRAMDEQWRVRYVAAVDEHERLQETLRTKEQAFADELAEARTQLEKLDARLGEREQQVAKLSSELMQSRMSSSDGAHELDALRASKRRLNETLDDTSARLREVEMQNATLSTRVSDLEAQVAAESERAAAAERLAAAAAAEARAEESAAQRRFYENELRSMQPKFDESAVAVAVAAAPGPPPPPPAATKSPAKKKAPAKVETDDKEAHEAAARKIQKMRRDSIAVRKAVQEKDKLKAQKKEKEAAEAKAEAKAKAKAKEEAKPPPPPAPAPAPFISERSSDEARAKEAAEMRKVRAKHVAEWAPPPPPPGSISPPAQSPKSAPPPPPTASAQIETPEEKPAPPVDPSKPRIERFSISGKLAVGSTITAKGAMKNCKKCRFKWKKHGPGEPFAPVPGAKRPTIVLTAADIGAMYCVDATPMAEDGTKGAMATAMGSEPVAVPPELQADARRRADGVSGPLDVTDVSTGAAGTLVLRNGQVIVMFDGAEALATSLDPGHKPLLLLDRGAPQLVLDSGVPGVPSLRLDTKTAELRDEFALAATFVAPRVEIRNADGGEADRAAAPNSSSAAPPPDGGDTKKAKAKATTRTKRGDKMMIPKASMDAASAVLGMDDEDDAAQASTSAAAAAPPVEKKKKKADTEKNAGGVKTLPGIKDLKVFSSPIGVPPALGCTLTATGYPLNGTTMCLFQWRRRHANETEWTAIADATTPEYHPSCDDDGYVLGVQCLPTNSAGVSGVAVEIVANGGNPLPLSLAVSEAVEAATSSGSGTFPATLKSNGDAVQLSLTKKELSILSAASRYKKAIYKVPLSNIASIGLGANRTEAVFSLTIPNARPPHIACELMFSDAESRDAAVLASRRLKRAAGEAPVKRGWFS